MRNGRAFRIGDLSEIVSDRRFFSVSMHLPGWWKSFLHGVRLKAMAGVHAHGDVSWSVVSSPLAFVGEEMRPISSDEFQRRNDAGMPVGVIEWAHLSMGAPQAEVIIATVHGPEDAESVWLFANCLEAPSLFHGFALQARLFYTTRRARKPLNPLGIYADAAPSFPRKPLGLLAIKNRGEAMPLRVSVMGSLPTSSPSP